MRILKWDPIFGPVSLAQDVQTRPGRDRVSDSSAQTPLLAGPTMQRQVGECLVGQAEGTGPGMAFGCTRRYAGRALLEVWFFEDSSRNDAFLADLFAGVEDAGSRTGWLMSCYQAMRQRGHWPLNLPLEQLLADEEVFIEWGEISPSCPASIQ